MQISSIAFHPTTKRFIAATGTGELTYWNVKDTQMENITQGHDSIIKKIIMSKNGSWMVSGDDEGILKIWQAGNLRLTKTIENTRDGLEKELLTLPRVIINCQRVLAMSIRLKASTQTKTSRTVRTFKF